jgi:hypothetical protein
VSKRAIAVCVLVVCCFCAVASPAAAQSGPSTGGAAYVPEPAPPAPVAPGQYTGPTVPGDKAVLQPDGQAAAPLNAPPQVQQAIWAANTLQELPYKYGGGHGDFEDDGYDCSGTVSFALHAAGLLERPLDSGSFMRWGEGGKGAWITVYTNPGHAYVVLAGLRLDTSSAGVISRRSTRRRIARSATERGPRWRPTGRPSRGFTKRHPLGF